MALTEGLHETSPHIKEESSTEKRQARDGVAETPHRPPQSPCAPHCLPHLFPRLMRHWERSPLRPHLCWTPSWDHHSAHAFPLQLCSETPAPARLTNVCVRDACAPEVTAGPPLRHRKNAQRVWHHTVLLSGLLHGVGMLLSVTRVD